MIRQQQISLYAAVAAIAAFIPFGALVSDGGAAVVIISQALWALLTAVGAWWLTRLTERRAVLLGTLIAAMMPIFYAPIVLLTGGYESAAFAWLVALPLAMVVIFRSMVSATVAGAALSTLAAFYVSAASAAPGPMVALRTVQVGVAGAMACVGAIAFSRGRQWELKAAAAREEAQRHLAQSGLERERAERLAALGQLSAALAHEINNPLAFMNANVEYLLRARRARQPLNEEEERELLEETRAGLERVTAIVAELTAVARRHRAATAAGVDPQMTAEEGRIKLSLLREEPEQTPASSPPPPAREPSKS